MNLKPSICKWVGNTGQTRCSWRWWISTLDSPHGVLMTLCLSLLTSQRIRRSQGLILPFRRVFNARFSLSLSPFFLFFFFSFLSIYLFDSVFYLFLSNAYFLFRELELFPELNGCQGSRNRLGRNRLGRNRAISTPAALLKYKLDFIDHLTL